MHSQSIDKEGKIEASSHWKRVAGWPESIRKTSYTDKQCVLQSSWFLHHTQNSEILSQYTLIRRYKIEPFGNNSACQVWRKKGCAYDPKNTMTTVKHGVGASWYGVWFSTNSTGTLHIIEENMNGVMNPKILEESLISLYKKLNLGRW